MRSGAARWTCGAIAWIALGAAAYFIFQTESRILASTASLRSIDRLAREAADALVDARVAQEAYVAQGQGIDFWMPKNAVSAERAAAALTALDEAVSRTAAHDALAQAKAALSESTSIDARARDYSKAGQPLMAGDVIFTEGGPAVASVALLIETARIAEQQAAYDEELAERRLEAFAAGGAGGFAGLVVLLLAPGSKTRGVTAKTAVASVDLGLRPDSMNELSLREPLPSTSRVDAGSGTHHREPRSSEDLGDSRANEDRSSAALRAAASLATDFGRVRNPDELSRVLAQTAEAMNATGLVVWMATKAGSTLQPVAGHGYKPGFLGKLPPVDRSSDNAAAAAYRTGHLQVVASRAGSAGAIVVPILSADGCIGALSAEIRAGSEAAESTHAVATIAAAHLAGWSANGADPSEASVANEPSTVVAL